MKSGLELVPIDQDVAFDFIERHHSTHEPPPGDVLRVGAMYQGELIGVATWGLPGPRGLRDGFTAEITRVATDGIKRPTGRTNRKGDPTFINTASFLEGACVRMAIAAGYRKVVTYQLTSQKGASIKVAGFRVVAQVRGRSWCCKSRPRTDKHPLQDKLRLERVA